MGNSPVVLDFSKAQRLPPLPAGYKLDAKAAVLPLPSGYTLDSAPVTLDFSKAQRLPPAGTQSGTERALQQGLGGPPIFVDVPAGQKQAFEQAGQRGYQTGAALCTDASGGATTSGCTAGGVTESVWTSGLTTLSGNTGNCLLNGSAGQCVTAIFPKAHTITRFTFTLETAPSGCSTNATFGIKDLTSSTLLTSITPTSGAFQNSGALSVATTAGDQLGMGITTVSSACTTQAVVYSLAMVYQ